MRKAAKYLSFVVAAVASTASAQSENDINIFYGFDNILHPIAIKWACGGNSSQDLAALNTLVSAFPEDAESAELPAFLETMQGFSTGQEGVASTLGLEVTSAQASQICAVALPLSVTWATPDLLISDDNEGGVPDNQREAWSDFWQVVQGI